MTNTKNNAIIVQPQNHQHIHTSTFNSWQYSNQFFFYSGKAS